LSTDGKASVTARLPIHRLPTPASSKFPKPLHAANRKHAVRALRRRGDKAVETEAPRERKGRYGATIKDAASGSWR
jgi:hypothetical protein